MSDTLSIPAQVPARVRTTPGPGDAPLAEARRIALRWGANGLTYLGLRQPHGVLFSPDGLACVGYTVSGGSAIALGGPAGPGSSCAALLESFTRQCHDRSLRPIFCGVPGTVAALLQQHGFGVTPVGDEAVIDPDAVSLAGKRWREVRVALNRARRRGVAFGWVAPRDRTHTLLREAAEVSRAWLASRGAPEMRFAVGSLESLEDPAVRLGVATGPDGRFLGLLTWIPVPGPGGWMLELLRRRPDAMAGLSDVLVGASLLSFRDEGCRYASLSGTPLANPAGTPAGPLLGALRLLLTRARAVYNYEGLRHFKAKFNPTWEPLYLAHQGVAGLPRALAAVATACAPNPLSTATLRWAADHLRLRRAGRTG